MIDVVRSFNFPQEMAEAQLSARKRDQTLLHMQWFGQRLRGWR